MAVVRCLTCRTTFVANPRDRAEEELEDYSARYEQEMDGGKAGACWRLFVRGTEGLPGLGSVLDVGCGQGAFLDLAGGAGLKTAGVEISADAAGAARRKGHRVFQASADGEPWTEGATYDVVTMWDLLEHLRRPGRALEAAFGALRPGGRLLVVTPMMDSIFDRVGRAGSRAQGGGVLRLLRMCWSQDHLFRFNPVGTVGTLRRMGFVGVSARPILLLSLGAEHYAGGQVMKSWGGRQAMNRMISRAGVLLAKRLGVRNKILIRASRPERG